MKIGIPTEGDAGLGESISSHFGRAPTFTIVDTDSEDVEVVTNAKKSGRSVQPPEHLAEEGVQVMLCSGLGPKAINLFEQFGIEVFVGAEGTVEQVLEDWNSGVLKEATDKDACEEHRRHYSP